MIKQLNIVYKTYKIIYIYIQMIQYRKNHIGLQLKTKQTTKYIHSLIQREKMKRNSSSSILIHFHWHFSYLQSFCRSVSKIRVRLLRYLMECDQIESHLHSLLTPFFYNIHKIFIETKICEWNQKTNEKNPRHRIL